MKRSLIFGLLFAISQASLAFAIDPLVPGTGQKVVQVGDDFEDDKWTYNRYGAKSSKNINGSERLPGGESANDRWYEGIKRGHPDYIKRVATPPKGLPGSKGALALRSLFTGIPGRPSFRTQQDDFICNVHYKLGGSIPVYQNPSCVTRVWLPPVDQWENRSGPHFAFRAALDTTVVKSSSSFFGSSTTKRETYWPGFFFEFRSKSGKEESDYAYLRIRADSRGNDFKGKQITVTGWWTLGMSFTADGRVHYFAKPGVENLTRADYLTSQYPYGYRCERFKTFFYNVCNGDDGKTWSSPFVIDDPTLYYMPTRQARNPRTVR